MCIDGDFKETDPKIVEVFLSRIRKKIGVAAGDPTLGNMLLRTVRGAGFMLSAASPALQEVTALPVLDTGWFRVVRHMDGQGQIENTEFMLSQRELLILAYLHQRPGSYVKPADMALVLFANVQRGDIRTGR